MYNVHMILLKFFLIPILVISPLHKLFRRFGTLMLKNFSKDLKSFEHLINIAINIINTTIIIIANISIIIRLSIALQTLRQSGQRRRLAAAGASNSPCRAFVLCVQKVKSENLKVEG